MFFSSDWKILSRISKSTPVAKSKMTLSKISRADLCPLYIITIILVILHWTEHKNYQKSNWIGKRISNEKKKKNSLMYSDWITTLQLQLDFQLLQMKKGKNCEKREVVEFISKKKFGIDGKNDFYKIPLCWKLKVIL